MRSDDNYWSRRVQDGRVSRRRLMGGAAVAGLGAASLGLVGCGGGDDDKGPAKSIEQKQEEVKSLLNPRTDTTAQAVKGGIMQSYTTADVTNLDPLSSPSFTANVVGNWLYPKLVRYKLGYRVPAIGDVEPYLAEKWEQPEPTKITFKLRPNAVWDDKLGKRAIDADDVVFSWNKFAAKGISRNDLAYREDNKTGPVMKIEAPDKTTVTMTLAFPYAPLVTALGYSRYLQVMPRESEGGFDPRNEVRSGGPYTLNYQKGVTFEYRKNPLFWEADKVLNDGVNYPIIAEYAAALAQFKAKKVWTSPFGAHQEDIIAAKKEFPELVLDQAAFTRGQSMLYFGLQPGSPFNDPRVRQAVSMLIDRDAFLDNFNGLSPFKKEGYPVRSAWHSHLSCGWEGFWLDPQGKDLGDAAKYWQLNVAEAKKLLSAAGFPNGVETTISYISSAEYGTTFPKQGEVLKSMLEEGGAFKLKIQNPDYQTEYLPKYYYNKGDFSGIAWGATTAFPEVDQYIHAYFHTNGARGKAVYKGLQTPESKKSDDMIEAQRRELDPAKRTAIIKDWQKYTATWMPQVLSPGLAALFSLTWPWVGNNGVFRGWDGGESDLPNVWTHGWFDKSKFTG